MDQVEVRPADEIDARFIALHVRQADFDELVEGSMLTPYQTMMRGIEQAPETAMTGTINHKPVVMFGVVDGGTLGNVGVPWMVGTKWLDQKANTFLRRSRTHLMEMFSEYDMLLNYVDARNVRAIQWLQWLGFTIEPPEPMGMRGLMFHKFWMMKVQYV